jgi:flavin reductase (DIM6/NTAB) family NADH-FMN oxidoreductase RutF/DNA-binding GntR family transcriptional regulator
MPTVSDAPTQSSFDSAVFRTVIGTVTSGVMVLTSRDDDGDHGMTISAVSSLSLEPPMLLVCLNMNSRTQQAVLSAGSFAVHVLDDRQAWIAERFAMPAGDDKFEGVTVSSGSVSAPVLSDALAVVECRVREAVTGGTHRVFLADVVHAQAREGSPLAYYRGKFGRFELAQDAKTYQRIRSMVLDCILGPDQELDAPTLAESLGAGLSSIHYALTRLVGEGLVVRTADRGYVVTPLDAARSDDAFDARLVIELGVAELTVGRLSAEQLAEFRGLALASVARLEDGRLVDAAEYVAAAVRFHAFLPALTGSPALQEAYERLSIADLMSRALTSETSVNPQMADDHLALVEAYERADVVEVRRIIREHSVRAKENQRADLAALLARSAGSPAPSQSVSPHTVSSHTVSSQTVPSQARET